MAHLADSRTDRAYSCRAMTAQLSPINTPVVTIRLLPDADTCLLHLFEQRVRAGRLVPTPVAKELLLQFDAPIVLGVMAGAKADELLLRHLFVANMTAMQVHDRPTIWFAMPPPLATE